MMVAVLAELKAINKQMERIEERLIIVEDNQNHQHNCDLELQENIEDHFIMLEEIQNFHLQWSVKHDREIIDSLQEIKEVVL